MGLLPNGRVLTTIYIVVGEYLIVVSGLAMNYITFMKALFKLVLVKGLYVCMYIYANTVYYG